MTTFYVRKTGSDGAAGTSPATAWLTIGKALTTGGVAAGDQVYIGGGVYREVVTASLTNPASEIRFVGDIDGAKTGDPGEVIWSAWTTDDTTAASASALLTGGSKNNLAFERIGFFVGGTGITTGMGSGWAFRECLLHSVVNGVSNLAQTVTAAGQGVTLDRCISVTGGSASNHVAITCTQSASAEYDCGATLRNSIFYYGTAVLTLTSTGSQTFKGGGGLIANCTCNNQTNVVSNAAGCSWLLPAIVVNSIIIGSGGVGSDGGVGGFIGENNRTIVGPALTDISLGLFNAVLSSTRAPYGEWGQAYLWGLSPRGHFGPTSVAFSATAPLGVTTQRAATGSDDSTVGSITWTSPTNANLGQNANYAVATSIPATTGVSHYLKVLGGITVPTGATIKGVRVSVVGKSAQNSGLSVSSIKLVKGGVISGNEGASFNTTAWVSFSDSHMVFRSTSDPLWGLTLTDTDVNAANFGVVVAFKNTAGTTQTMNVALIRVEVSWQLDTDTTQIQTVDLLNRPRPSGLNQTTGQTGAFERHDYGTKETSVTHGGSAALKLTGPGDHQFDVPVDATATTITAYMRFDTTHGTTTRPQMIVLDSPDIGVTTATATMTAAVDTWEQLTLTFTPTAKGIVTLRFRNRAAAASGLAYVDDVVVS